MENNKKVYKNFNINNHKQTKRKWKIKFKDKNKSILNKNKYKKDIKTLKKLKRNYSTRNNINKQIKFYRYKLFLKLLIVLLFIFFPFYIKSKSINDYFSYSNTPQIKVAFFCSSIRYGGVERVVSLLVNILSKEKKFEIYLITTKGKLDEEYPIPNNIKRIDLYDQRTNIYAVINQENIDVVVYNFYHVYEMARLNRLKKTKIIYINHSPIFNWIIITRTYNFKSTIYQAYKNCKYVVSLIPMENDYLFKKWGINSVLMENPNTFDYDSVIPSDLSSKNIIMIGRAGDPTKRVDLGIKAMKNIIKEIPECRMNIISKTNNKMEKLIKKLNLENYINITGFQQNPEPYLKNASLHIFPSVCEAFPMVLSEAKMFGIPTIICGLDYLYLAKGGTIIIYDDNPDTIAVEAIKILKNDNYRRKLGKEARESMKIHKNEIIQKKWVKLIISVYNGIDGLSYTKLFRKYNKLVKEKEANRILNNQLNLLKKRIPHFSNLTLEKLKNYSFV